MYIVILLSVSTLGLAGSTAKCANGPIRDFGEFGTTYTDLHCVFQDVCWHPRDGLLFNLTESHISGPWPIEISGSSVPNHDGLTIDITPVSLHTLNRILASSHVEVTENGILLRPFLPGNLFHVLHDDILPVYAMKESLAWLNLTLFLTENPKQGFDAFYALLRLPLKYAQPGTIRCFHKLFVGLPKITLWYQYGFKSPQSTLPGTDISILREFINELTDERKLNGHRRCTVLTRSLNRRILNLEELRVFLTVERNCSVEIVSLESSFEELRTVLSATDLLISMHGAELSLIILLPEGAVVIELFPYAIKFANYTPYKRLCEFLGLIYEPWVNENPTNNVAFPEKWLSALSEAKRNEILNSRVVEPHLCCSDAAWLFRIYQDTKIDLFSLRNVLRKTTLRRDLRLRCANDVSLTAKAADLSEVGKQARGASISEWESFWRYLLEKKTHQKPFFYPGRVRELRCTRGFNDIRAITWRTPINHDDVSEEGKIYFEILSRCASETRFTRTERTSFVSSPCNNTLTVWVQANKGIKPIYPLVCD